MDRPTIKIRTAPHPCPPARMIRPSALVFWNSIKSGIDVYSSLMISFARTNVSEDPLASIIARLLFTLISNSANVYRSLLAASKRKIPTGIAKYDVNYFTLRKRITKKIKTGSFIRPVFVERLKTIGINTVVTKRKPISDVTEIKFVKR